MRQLKNLTYFREHVIPAKRSFKRIVQIKNYEDLLRVISVIGKFTDIKIDAYPADKRRSYTKDGTVIWIDNLAITGIDQDGCRQNIGYINNSDSIGTGKPR